MATPYKQSTESKKEQVAAMFDSIAGKYDFLNHFLSAGIDIVWRKKAIAMLQEYSPRIILDVATGTGDFAIEAMSLKPEKIIGIDISEGMLNVGRKKIKKKNLDKIIEMKLADSEKIPFPDNIFDAITVGFGVRNFENPSSGIADMYRVLKPGGTLVVLEFSKPEKFPVKQLYHFYFNNILPFIGKIVSKDNTAYTYLPESVGDFASGNGFLNLLDSNGFKNTSCRPLTFGIASIYVGKKQQ